MTMIISINITYHLNDLEENYEIETNAKRSLLPDLLLDFIRSQVGLGEDNRTANEKDVYEVFLTLNMQNDAWTVKTDTGNDGLTLGLVMDVLKKLSKKHEQWEAI